MSDGIEAYSCVAVRKNQGSQPFSVEAAVRRKDLRTESRDHLSKTETAGSNHFARQLVGVDDRYAALAQQGRDGALARADATGEAKDAQRHGRSVPESDVNRGRVRARVTAPELDEAERFEPNENRLAPGRAFPQGGGVLLGRRLPVFAV